ncbi:MAG: TrmH family RNA methyltransferase, partial [Alkalispirochaetaceae bacterium]
MISLRKLHSLPPPTRLRKIVRLLDGFERSKRRGERLDGEYILGLLAELEALLGPRQPDRSSGRREPLAAEAALFAAIRELQAAPNELRRLNRLRNRLEAHLGKEPADWDLLGEPGEEHQERSTREEGQRRMRLFPIALCLEELRSPFNLGSIARSAEAFGAAGLILAAATARPEQPRAKRAAMGAFDHLPVCELSLPWSERPEAGREGPPPRGREGRGDGTPLFALESGGTPIDRFTFPKSGICLIGSEELGLSAAALEAAERSWGRCSIPLYG